MGASYDQDFNSRCPAQCRGRIDMANDFVFAGGVIAEQAASTRNGTAGRRCARAFNSPRGVLPTSWCAMRHTPADSGCARPHSWREPGTPRSCRVWRRNRATSSWEADLQPVPCAAFEKSSSGGHHAARRCTRRCARHVGRRVPARRLVCGDALRPPTKRTARVSVFQAWYATDPERQLRTVDEIIME